MNFIFFSIGLVFFLTFGLFFVFFLLKKQKDDKENKEGRTELLLKNFLEDFLKTHLQRSDTNVQEIRKQNQEFSQSISQMQVSLKHLDNSVKTSADKLTSFHDLFKTPKLRGQWGESSLETLLLEVFPKEMFKKGYRFKNGDIVDFAVFLPNKFILPIDSKFPSDVFGAYAEEKDEQIKKQKLQIFIQRIKNEIDSIGSKYIKPEEGTTENALMYVPAEAMYYEIISRLNEEIFQYAQKKKIILVSPNTFYLTLGIINHWFRDITVAQKTKEIIKKLSQIIEDSRKLGETFGKLGRHLSEAQGSYEDSEKRLEFLTNRVEKVIEIGDKEGKELPASTE